MSNNLAAILPAAKAQLVVEKITQKYTPGPGEVLIKNHSISINPFDGKLQRYAMLPLKYPVILGMPLAGVVQEVGPDVDDFKVGDRVAASPAGPLFKEQKYQAWQRYVVVDRKYVASLGDTMDFNDASGTIANLLTIIGAFTVAMDLGRITPGETPCAGKKILVYGGSSAVGGLATQVAARLGATVITTSSPRNRAEVERRGASKIIDHTQDAERTVSELAREGPYDYIFDTVAGEEATSNIAKVVQSQGPSGTKTFFSTDPRPGYNVPSDVERKAHSYPGMVFEDEELCAWFFEMFGPAIEQGRLLPSKVEKVPGGLHKLQECVDRTVEGKVSGVKLVVDPWDEV